MVFVKLPEERTKYISTHTEDIAMKTAWAFRRPLWLCADLLQNAEHNAVLFMEDGHAASLYEVLDCSRDDIQAGTEDLDSMIYVLKQGVKALRHRQESEEKRASGADVTDTDTEGQDKQLSADAVNNGVYLLTTTLISAQALVLSDATDDEDKPFTFEDAYQGQLSGTGSNIYSYEDAEHMRAIAQIVIDLLDRDIANSKATEERLAVEARIEKAKP